MSAERRELAAERRATDRERTVIRHAERHSKASARVMFGGAR